MYERDVRCDADRRTDSGRRPADGLSSSEAAERVGRYGRNAIQDERRSLLLEVAGHFWGPIAWMIEAALC